MLKSKKSSVKIIGQLSDPLQQKNFLKSDPLQQKNFLKSDPLQQKVAGSDPLQQK